MSVELPADPNARRRARLWTLVSLGIVVALVVLVAYLGYLGFEGSRQMVNPISPSADCRTPASAYGWEYEAINYDKAGDDVVLDYADPHNCPQQGPPAGDELISSDGTRLAGWYIPSASGSGPAGATVVLLHGHGSNKSDMLDRAEILHDDYNLVLFDFRDHGQSSGEQTTVGVKEESDLDAVLDWLESTKAPDAIATLGVSMGGAIALNEAVGDQRVRAVIAESTHATLANAVQARLEERGYPLALPGAWSILMGGLIRTGQDMSAVDAIQAAERYGDRPLLIISGGQDHLIGRSDPQDLEAAARQGGAQVELRVCDSAGHARAADTCHDDYADWVLGFLAQALPRPT